MARKKVLVVDDERDISDIVAFNLRREQYDVVSAVDGESAVEIARRDQPDLVLLDLMLPGIGGLEVCRRIRADPRTAQIPIIMLTAKGEETDAIVGLAQGADDYVRKPFGVKELMARVAAQLRAQTRAREDDIPRVLRFGLLEIDSDRFVAALDGRALPFTTTEFKLLRHLVAKKGRVFSRNDLLDAVRGPDAVVTDRTIDVHVASVRRKLEEYGEYLVTVRGVGYKFAETVEA
ncbi:MAG: response regulator [Planctomycetes bacterium]|nr:response regulator [Planctomycetota bacterium]